MAYPRAGDDYQPRRYWGGLHRADDLTVVGHPTLPLVFNRHLYRNVTLATLRGLARSGVQVRGRRVLDIGSGTGFWIDLWREQGARVTAGSDLVPEAVERLRERFRGSDFAVADITETTPFPGIEFDVVTVASVLHHIVDHDRFRAALVHLAAQVERGGHLVVIDPLVVRGRWLPRSDEGAHNVTRTRAQWDAAAGAAGLRLVSVTPVASFLISDPVDAGSRAAFAAQRFWWRALTFSLRHRDGLASIVVPPLAALDRAVVRRSRCGTSSKLLVLERSR